MRLTCPKCGEVFDTAKAKAKPVEDIEATYKSFGFSEDVVREYMKLFGQCYLPKEARLLKELKRVWDEEYFERGGRGWRVTRDQIAGALTTICNNQPALKTHGYLCAVLKSKAIEADIRAERDKHERAASRTRRPQEPHPHYGDWHGALSEKDLAGLRKSSPSLGTGEGGRGAGGSSPSEPQDPEAIRRLIAETKKKLGCTDGPTLTEEEMEARRRLLQEQAKQALNGGV